MQRVSHFPETEIDNHKEWRAPLAGPGTGAFDLAWGGAVRLTLHLYTFGPTHLNTHHHPERPFQLSLDRWFVLRGHSRSF